ncbi:MAG: MarR family transcriptional regulator [Tenericutes bacterium]|nr:MarR family transcriptional regulator [Mycoplasmatota bacterium]
MDKTKIMIALTKLNITLINNVGKDIYNYGITPTEFKIISHLYVKGKSKTQRLGEIAFITSGAITYFVNKLLEKEYVIKYKDKSDKRITWIELTDNGKEFYEEMLPKHIEFLDTFFEVFEEEELDEFYKNVRSFEKKIRKQKGE